MLFKQKHRPTQFGELVFSSHKAELVLREYAEGKRRIPLIIYGPHGSGKSTAADMIRKTIAVRTKAAKVTPPIYSRMGVDQKIWGDLIKTMTQNTSPRGYLQIDDTDCLSDDLIDELDAIIETPRFGTVIMTVKDLSVLPAWVQSRCEKVQLLFPTANQLVPRALSILHAEGLQVTAADVRTILYTFEGNWWDVLRLLENYVIAQRNNSLV